MDTLSTNLHKVLSVAAGCMRMTHACQTHCQVIDVAVPAKHCRALAAAAQACDLSLDLPLS